MAGPEPATDAAARDPQIRVTCTEELETQLLDALDRAKNARNAAALDALTDLTVSVVRARRNRL